MIALKSSNPLDYSLSLQNISPLCIPRPSDTKEPPPYPSGSKPSRKPVGPRQSNKVTTDIFSLNRDPKLEQGGPVQAISHSQYAARTSATRHVSTRSSSASWDLEADRLLIEARSRDMNWGPIQQTYFPNKSANACRKRHERLMSMRNNALCSSEKEEKIAQSYIALRKETWAPIAAQTGEKWHVVEQKVFQLGRVPAVQLHPNRHDDGIEVSTDEEQAKSKITATLPVPTAPEVSPAHLEDPTLRLSLSNNVPSNALDWKDQKNHVIRSPSSARTVSTFSPVDSSSSGDDGCLLTRSEQKRVLLDRLMRYFYSIFSVFPSLGPYIREHGAGKGTSTFQTSGDHRHSYQSQSPAHCSNSISSIVGKRQAEDDNEDGCDRKRPLLKLNDFADDQSQRLACPFFKKDPRQYQGGSRSCSGPGWFTVHRIKYVSYSYILYSTYRILKISGNIFIGVIHFQSVARDAMKFFRQTD